MIPPGASWVTNGDDTDDNCYSNVHDCAGTCDGELVVDDCGVCGGGNQDQDCAGECFGDNTVDECGTCDADSSNDCVQDCAGVWGGTASEGTFWMDMDGDGLGFGQGYDFCDALAPDGWVTNGDDLDDNCFENEYDCSGACGGELAVDECGVCGGLGAVYECGCSDIAEGACDCDGNVLDECDVCGGSGIPDGECDCSV